MRWQRDESGMVVVEWLLGFGLLVVSAVGVLSLPAWFERTNMAHIAAREAARAVVVATDPSSGEDRGRELVAEIAANHGVDPATVSVAYSGDANPGGAVTAQVTVQLPALSIPFVGGVGAKQWSTTHTELVDLYRSSPRSSP